MARLTFHGHATCSIVTEDGIHLVIDPFFEGNPLCPTPLAEVAAHYILATHGHRDHIRDLVPLARRTGATVISSHELVGWAESQGVEATHAMSIGGAFTFPFGRVKLTPALHGTANEGPGGQAFPTMPAGLLLELGEGQRVYHAGDTALLMDMQLLRDQVDLALLPIGDNYTMGPADAVRAIEFIRPRIVVPVHYDTFPVIEQDAGAFRDLVGDRARVEILTPGASMPF